MAPNDTKQGSVKSSRKSTATPSSERRKETPSKPREGSSKSGINEKRTRVSETVIASKDPGALSKSGVKPMVQESAIHQYREKSVRQSAEFAPIGKGISGQRSASSTGSQSDQYDPSPKVNSLESSATTIMSEATEYDRAPGLESHPTADFSPGRIVVLECFDDSDDLIHSRKGTLSPKEFLEMDNAREGKNERFAIFKTYPDYSMAVRIHTYNPSNPKEAKRDPAHQAIIYADAGKPRKEAWDEPLTNQPIQVEGLKEMPSGSRLDYSDVFVVEHNLPVAFVGRIISSFDAFAATYRAVQARLGHDVPLPTLRPDAGRCSYEASSGEAYVPPTDNDASMEQNAATNASWFGEVPNHQRHRVDLSRAKTETNPQHTLNPLSAQSRPLGRGLGGISDSNFGMQIPPMVAAYASAEDDAIAASRRWIDEVKDHLKEMMARVLKRGETVEGICNSRARSGFFAASRVRVAVLDTEVNIKSEVFRRYETRIKDYWDRTDGGTRAAPNTHGTHVGLLFLQVAPEADVYFARAFDDKTSLAEGIIHAVKEWKVDIISISGGVNTHDYGIGGALRLAYAMQVSVFAATHNNGNNTQMSYPARAPNVYPVSSTDYYGKIIASATDAMPHKLSFATLGQNIDTFWMADVAKKLRNYKLRTHVSGSSFATPLAAGMFASTLLAARIIYHGEPNEPCEKQLKDQMVMDGLMKRISVRKESTPYLYVWPKDLWKGKKVGQEIERVFDRVTDGLLE